MAVFLTVLIGLSACAEKRPGAWQKDKQIVIASIKQFQNEQQSLKQDLSVLKGRMVELEQAQMVQNSAMDAQNASIRQLQTSITYLEAMATKSKKSSRITKQKLVRKLDKIVKSISKPIVTPLARPPVGEEKNHYTAAYLALKSGRYEEATNSFRSLLKKFPKGEYADQAWYWLGESYYAQHKIKQAIHAFETVIKRYPGSAKHAAALLKLGLAYQDTARMKNARAILQRLIREHPDSAAAEQARRQLKALPERNP